MSGAGNVLRTANHLLVILARDMAEVTVLCKQERGVLMDEPPQVNL